MVETVHVSNTSELLFSAPGIHLGPLREVGSNLISILQMWKLRFRTLNWLELAQLTQRNGS